MKNVAITLDEKTAAWVRVSAAREDKSVSRYIGEMLEKRMRDSRDYANAMRRYLGWDALVVAAAREQGCAVLLTEDLQDGALIDGVRIRNPFSYSAQEASAETHGQGAKPRSDRRRLR